MANLAVQHYKMVVGSSLVTRSCLLLILTISCAYEEGRSLETMVMEWSDQPKLQIHVQASSYSVSKKKGGSFLVLRSWRVDMKKRWDLWAWRVQEKGEKGSWKEETKVATKRAHLLAMIQWSFKELTLVPWL